MERIEEGGGEYIPFFIGGRESLLGISLAEINLRFLKFTKGSGGFGLKCGNSPNNYIYDA